MSFEYPILTNDTIPIDTSKNSDNFLNLKFILEFLIRVLRIWMGIPAELINFTRLSAAMTNTVYIISHPLFDTNNGPKKILLRVYGEGVEQILDRNEELDWFMKLSEAGVGPRLLATFSNGRFEEFIESVTLTPTMMRDAKISDGIATTMTQFHSLQINVSGIPVIWERINKWRNEARKAFDSLLLKKPEKIETLIKISEYQIIDDMSGKYEKFFDLLNSLGSPILPCHNDLQHGNILLSEEDKRIIFIDYEYGGLNYAAYDIANHFCEWASDFTDSNPTPHLMNFSQNYPTLMERRRFIRKYLGPEGGEEDVERWLDHVEKFKDLSHLLWAYWGVIQENNSTNDFDYLGYSLMRLEAMNIL